MEFSSTGHAKGQRRTVNVMITGSDWDFIELIDELQWVSPGSEKLTSFLNALHASTGLVEPSK